MADGEDQAPASPPLPKKGSYNIDFDAFDETSNPFQAKSKLGSSPPTRSGHLPATFEDDDTIDPFKPRTKLSSSPPGSPRLVQPSNTPRLIQPSNNNMDDVSVTDIQQSTPVNPKKKKIVRKSKVQPKKESIQRPNTDQENVVESMKPDSDRSALNVVDIVEEKPISSSKKQLPRKKVRTQALDNDVQAKMEESERDKLPACGIDEAPPLHAAPEAVLPSSGQAPPLYAAPEAVVSLVAQAPPLDASPEAVVPSSGQAQPLYAAPEAVVSLSAQGPPLDASPEAVVSMSGQAPPLDAEPLSGQAPPLDAAPEAMVSSSEADHQFVDRDGLSDILPNSNAFCPSSAETSEKGLSQSERARRSTSHELPAVNTPARGSIAKHPASRALEAAAVAAQADNSLKVQENKNESSSEEAQFYDAYDYPPVTSHKTKLGQKSSTEMDQTLNREERGDSKGAVVQLVQVLRYSQSDLNKMKQDLELNFQTSLLNKERDWSMMLAERDKRITALEESNRKVKHTNEDMRMIVAEFEKTISQLQAEKEKSRTDLQKAVQDLEGERDQAVEDLQSVESAFSDLHRRYEKSKSIIEGFKRNEEQLKQCVEELQTKLKKSDLKLQSLRSQAEEKLDKANEDIEKMKKSTKADTVRLEAALKKAELRISSLEESLHRKEKENQELTAICDELIAKVGS